MASSLELLETQSLLAPIGHRWDDAKDLHHDFENRFSSIFNNMLYCAICSSTKLINKLSINHMNTKAQNVFGTIPSCIRYGIANYFIAKYTTYATGSFMNICSKCKTSDNPNDHCPYIVTMTPKYLSNFLS
jgi:hypothetical protein